ncbi:MAG: thiamine phosphate synthase [Bacteroidota bacterium]
MISELLLIADRFTDSAVADKVKVAVDAGVGRVQLRDHGASEARFRSAARNLIEYLRERHDNILIGINARLEVAVEFNAAFHTGFRGPDVSAARKRLGDTTIGYSAHSVEEAVRARDDGADYVVFSPIFSTSSKPDATPRGLTALERVSLAIEPTPVFALGGITPERVASCLRTGARGVAVLSGILDAADPAEAVARYVRAVRFRAV